VPGNCVVDTNDVKDSPGRAGRDDDPRWRLEIAAGDVAVAGLSSCSASPSAHKSLPQKREAADVSLEGGTEWQLVDATTLEVGTKRAATLRSVRRGGPAPNGAARATRDRRDRKRAAVRGGCGAGAVWPCGESSISAAHREGDRR